MPCTSPRTVGYKSDGKTITWSPKEYSTRFKSFQLPCGKCIECRLAYAREWSIRCIHEAQMHEENSFITLTYSEENCPQRLDYKHFQEFIKKLRKAYPNAEISYFVTGEYGDIRKRPHWHAIIFGWRPTDCVYKYSNERGDKVYQSNNLDKIWANGITEVGSVTIESANYCARYAAKKLTHGKDQEHDFHPISKKSNKRAIGKKWLEKYWKDVFNHGYVEHEGKKLPIPRYYKKWLEKHNPKAWSYYYEFIAPRKNQTAERMAAAENEKYIEQLLGRDFTKSAPKTRNQVRAQITKAKFKQLQEKLKL